MEIIGGIIVCVGLVIAGWFAAKFWIEKGQAQGFSLDEIDKKYVSREMYAKIESDLQGLREENNQRNQTILSLNGEVRAKEQQIKSLNEKLDNEKNEIEKLQNKLTAEFKNIANQILQERSDQFLTTSKTNIESVLSPLNMKISDFRTRVD